MYRAVARPPWSPSAAQARWPARFRAAIRTTLLAAHRRTGAASGAAPAAAPSLSALPHEGVLAVLAAAAYPLAAWRPRAVASPDRLHQAFLSTGDFEGMGVELASFITGPGGSMTRVGLGGGLGGGGVMGMGGRMAHSAMGTTR